jgi:predicted Zn-dependent peptidase
MRLKNNMKFLKSQMSKVSKILLLTIISLSFICAGYAQTGKTNIAEQAALVTEFDVNGLKVLVKRRQSAPTVAAGLFIRGGAQNITDKNAGIESLMLNAAAEGSKKYSREALRRELARTGSSVGSSVSNDYSALSMVSTRQNFDRTWDVFTDIALNPAFAAADIELTREKILTGLRNDEDSPDSFLQVLQDRVIYAKHPYSNDVRGTIETISRFTAADLRAYHQKSLQTSQLLLVVVGDLDAKDLQKRITDSFGKLPRGDYKAQPLPALNFTESTLDITARTLPTNYIQGVFNAPSLNNPDYYAMRVATALLRDRVFEEVRVKRNLSYAPSADLGLLASNTANIYVLPSMQTKQLR